MAASCGLFLLLGAIMMIKCYSLEANATEMIPYICNTSTIPKTTMDKAVLTINNAPTQQTANLTLYTQSEECESCKLRPTQFIMAKSNCSIIVDTRWPMRVAIKLAEKGNEQVTTISPSCNEANLSRHFLEGEVVEIYIRGPRSALTCTQPTVLSPPSDANIPIYVAISIIVFLAMAWVLLKSLYRKGTLHRLLYFWSTEGMMVDLGTPTNINAGEENNKDEKSEKKERLRSLDTFRGMSILIMIFVNYKGGGYWYFNHSIWNGLTVADLVFPWFVWIMGTSMVFSFSGQLRRAVSRRRMLFRVVKRSAILFLLGLLINTADIPGGVVLTSLRIPGVLQRFAGTYLIVATIHLMFAKSVDENQHRWWAPVRDILDYWQEWIVHIVLVVVWICLTLFLTVPDCPTGYLGPGGLHDGGKHYNCTGGAAGYIDRLVFGESHIYQNPTCKKIYLTTMPYDPEGLLGTLTSCFLCFLGLQAGKILFQQRDWVQRCKRFVVWGILLGIIAAILCKGVKNGGYMPVNKNLWSLSYVLAMASFAFILFMFCYLMIDVWKIWSGAPFYYPGMNPIVLYVGHELFTGRSPVYFQIVQNHTNSLAMTAWGTFFWFLVSAYLFHKGVIITV